MTTKFSEQLESELKPYWARLRNTRVFRTLMEEETVDIDLLRLYLLESYHYVKHNAQHQAMVVWRCDVRERLYMKKMLRHAIEEVDHDQLALNDLVKLGIDRAAAERSTPLAQTAALTGYLYYEVTRGNPYGRLGYSLWAEGANHLIHEVVAEIKKKLRITDDRDLTFFVAHASLDERHHAEASEAIDRFVKTAEDREAVRRVAFTSFEIFLNLLEALYERHQLIRQGAAPLLRERMESSLAGVSPSWI